jgi:prolyl-tRNA synthetase
MLAEHKAVVVPIIFEDSKKKVLDAAQKIAAKLKAFDAFVDSRDNYSAGWKFNEWELKGIPLRIEVGPKDIAKKQAVIVRRDTGKKIFAKEQVIAKEVEKQLSEMQDDLFRNAKKFLDSSTVEAKDWKQFREAIEGRKLVYCYFCNTPKCEQSIKEETTATSRCIPFEQKHAEGKCAKCGTKTKTKAYFAKSY